MSFTMNRKTFAYAAGLALASVVPLSSAGAQDVRVDYDLTQDVRRTAQQAQAAIAQNNFTAAASYLNQAMAQARTDGDRYVIASMQLDVANRTFNTAAQAAALDSLLQNPVVGTSQRSALYFHRARVAYLGQDVDGANSLLTAAINAGSTDPRTFVALSALKTQRGEHAEALQLFNRGTELLRSASTRPPMDWFRRAIDIAERVPDPNSVVAIAVSLVNAYPETRNWRDALTLYRKYGTTDPQMQLDAWRLQAASGALAGEGDYQRYAQLARNANALPEIERLVIAGRENGMLDGRNAQISALDRGTTAARQALASGISGRATAATSASTGANAFAVGNDYMLLGDYANAATLYRAAIEKGAADAGLANLRYGMALALSGQYAPAREILDTVTGTQAPLARMWSAFAYSKQMQAAQTTAS